MHANVCKLISNNLCKPTVNMISNSNNKNEDNYSNVNLAEFKINIKTLSIDSIREIYYR